MKPTEYPSPNAMTDCLFEKMEQQGYVICRPFSITQDELDDRSTDANDLLQEMLKAGLPITVVDYSDDEETND